MFQVLDSLPMGGCPAKGHPATKSPWITNRLFELNLRSDGSVTGVRSHNLSVPAVEQIALAGWPWVVVTTPGRRFRGPDRATGKVRTLMAHEPRKPGFRSYPQSCCARADLLATGFFYDEEDYGGPTPSRGST